MVDVFAPVQAPPAAPPRMSLLAAAQLITGEDARWTDGLTFVPEGSAGGGAVAPCTGDFGNPERAPDAVKAHPYYVWEGDECSTIGGRRRDETAARARRALQATESYHIAREFWKGTVATAQGWTDQPVLASAASDVLTSGPATPLEAMVCLEQGLADAQRGRRGMIHCTPALATLWQNLYLLRREGTLLLTALDTIVVVDAGYDGSSPGGAAATDGDQWAYATGLVQVRLDAVQVLGDEDAQVVDRSVNNVTVYASRLAAVSWDGWAHLAAEVDVPLCLTGGVS